MARTKRSAKLDTRNARRGLSAETRHQEPLSPGRYLAYRKPKSEAAGSWMARWYDKETHLGGQERLGTADDYQDADGENILTYAQAQAKANAYFSEREHQALHGGGSLQRKGPLTVAQTMDRYLAEKEAMGAKSVKDAKQRSELWITPTLGKIEVAKLTRQMVKAWHLSVANSERKSRPKKALPVPKHPRKKNEAMKLDPEKPKTSSPEASPDEAKRKRKATANRILSNLKAALNHARREGWVTCPGDAWELVSPFKGVEEPRQDYLTPIQQQLLLNAIKASDFKNLVSGALTTGCRYGELSRMKVRDFNPTGAGSIHIRETKSGKPRDAMLTKDGKAFFESLTAGRDGNENMFRHDPGTVDRRRRGGDPLAWNKNDQQRLMRQACEEAGLPVMGFHQLRHSYASALVAAGMPLALVAKLTGHADTRMLERHYAHLAPSDLTKALEAMAPKLELPVGNTSTLKVKGA